jgi:hypothetical protein
MGTRMVLAKPGRTFVDNWPNENELYADMTGRPVAPSLALVRAIRQHVSELVARVPDAWERQILTAEGRGQGLEFFLGIPIRHLPAHVREIRQIREGHGR